MTARGKCGRDPLTTKHSNCLAIPGLSARKIGGKSQPRTHEKKLLADARRLPFVERELADLKGYLRSLNKLEESKAFSKGKWGAGVLRPTEV